MRWMMLAVAVAAIISSSGCCSLPGQPRLPLPPPLDLPRISEAELLPLTDATYEKLLKRDRLQDGRIRTLEEIIKTTWK